jgi:putative molybdopterin biosynthesis protein
MAAASLLAWAAVVTLAAARPSGAAAAVVQQRADWGLTLDTIARTAGLGFIPVQHEQYDFVTPKARAQREPVHAFRALLESQSTRDALTRLGLRP